MLHSAAQYRKDLSSNNMKSSIILILQLVLTNSVPRLTNTMTRGCHLKSSRKNRLAALASVRVSTPFLSPSSAAKAAATSTSCRIRSAKDALKYVKCMPAILASGICTSGVFRICFNSGTVKSPLLSLSSLWQVRRAQFEPAASVQQEW